MKNSSWRRMAARLALVLPLVAAPMGAQGWAAASHARMAKQTLKKAGLTDGNELCNRLYGANAVDLFNTVFTPEGQLLSRVLHDRDRVIEDAPWAIASTDGELAFAYGFASHNELWGTDATAHYVGMTFGEAEGYVIAKARLMAAALHDQVLPLVGSDEMLLFVSHILTEHAVDLLIVGAEPEVAADLMASAGCAAPAGVQLLVDALVPYFAPYVGAARAEELIRTTEPGFRLGVYLNGLVLAQPNARELLAGVIAEQAKAFLPGPFPPDAELIGLIDQALLLGMYLNAPDYLAELEATRGWVNGRLSSRGISP